MICFKDETFCVAPCSVNDCTKKLTKEVTEAADRWWAGCSGSAPIAMSDYSDTCEHFIKETECQDLNMMKMN